MERFSRLPRLLGYSLAQETWRDMSYVHSHMFLIPNTLKTDRTFARDEIEVLYLDHMDAFFRSRRIETIRAG